MDCRSIRKIAHAAGRIPAPTRKGRTEAHLTREVEKVMNAIKLYKHVTDGGAIYLTDVEDNFAKSRIIIRLDGEPEAIIREEMHP